MRNSYIILLLCFVPFLLLGQSKQDLRPCGTTEGRSAWLKKYQKNPGNYEKGADSTILYIPLTIHNVGTDVGTAYFKNRSLLDALCVLNADFAASNIQFFIESTINRLPSTNYNVHETVLDGAEMMFANNLPNTLNCYIVNDPAGACGYNLPYGGIALAKNCAGINDHTWAHEVGHAFKLPHPFLGWEGGVSHDDSIEHDYDDPAPTKVLLDYTYFKDTLIIDTLIIDTVWVELVERTNCDFAGDGFCDTEADYLNYRWQCNNDAVSSVEQTDPTGAKFVSDATLIMSYSSDDCAMRFSEDQIAAMRANILDEQPELLYNQSPRLPVEDTPITAISPLDGDVVSPESIYFEWKNVPNATHYVFELSRFASFSVLQIDTIIEGTTFEISDLLDEKNYHWRVRPFNSHSFCTSLSERFGFETGTFSSTKEEELVDTKIYPSLLQQGSMVNIDFNSPKRQAVELVIYDINGQALDRLSLKTQIGENQFQLPLSNYPKGIYLIQLQSETGRRTERVLVY